MEHKYMKIAKIFSVAAVSVSLVSCEGMWKEKPTNDWDQKYIWSVAEMAQGVLYNAYEAMPAVPDSYGSNFLDVATDNALTNNYNSTAYNLAMGKLSTTNNPIADWADCYKSLQYVNLFLENGLTENTLYDRVDPVQDEAYKKRLYGEAHFLRAYWGFRLLQQYGGKVAGGSVLGYPKYIYFVTEDEAADLDAIERATYEDCVQQIMSDCDAAIENLPSSYSGSDPVLGDVNIGRATALVAAALKSRVALYAASPAYRPDNVVRINGMGDFTVTDEAAYASKWEEAALIADETIRMEGFGTEFYALQATDLADVANTTPSEFLMRSYYNNKALETRHFPPYYLGTANTVPSQNLVDAFPMKNGYPVDNPASGYDKDNPYANRDNRFYLNVYYHGAKFGNNGEPVNVIYGGKDSPAFDQYGSRSGYYLAKFLSKNEAMLDPLAAANVQHYYPIFRKAEVFLNYAEAANEAWGPTGNPQGCLYSAYDIIKIIREKSGGITDTGYLDEVAALGKDEFRKLIQNERRLELAFENHRYFDMRRWLLDLTEPVYGVTVTEEDGQFIYDTGTYLEDRKFDGIRYYYAPLPYDECVKSPNLVNNLGWE